MKDPINKPAVREIVRECHPHANAAEVEYITRRAIGEAEIALHDRIRVGIPVGLRDPVRDASTARR